MAKSVRHFLRCPCCGTNIKWERFTRGALGHHSLQALAQNCVGAPYGTNGGSYIWDRRPMNREELMHVARALATAVDQISKRLDDDLDESPPEEVLASMSDDELLGETAAGWIEEAEKEVNRRTELVYNEIERRNQRRV